MNSVENVHWQQDTIQRAYWFGFVFWQIQTQGLPEGWDNAPNADSLSSKWFKHPRLLTKFFMMEQVCTGERFKNMIELYQFSDDD